ncbi:aspartate dehydrogenase [Pseudovibrio sp. FO-BEG1]|uniref:aspartate dehydrogenase n=1 Tax=Pseudovibrio sp. (strain FO-BEG1) TaxID=911045 RepID=UPI0002D3CCFA|nr:aspartate dehydrogenase [Pseudovibrio sp. FO-BEG1]
MRKLESIAIAGLGAIGKRVAQAVIKNEIPGYELKAIAVRDIQKGKEFLKALPEHSCQPLPLDELPLVADIVLECLPPQLFEKVARPTLSCGKSLIVMSTSQLLSRMHLLDLAKQNGANIIVPSGAILGLDALKAAAEGTIQSVVVRTSKPPQGLAGAAYLIENSIDVESSNVPTCILSGSVNEVAQHFPANVNVAAALALAGLGADKTTMEIWADPNLSKNTHTVSVTSDSSDFTMTISNRPSDENPRTGRITAQSVLAVLRTRTSHIQIGS